jgi:hypothetical protein
MHGQDLVDMAKLLLHLCLWALFFSIVGPPLLACAGFG